MTHHYLKLLEPFADSVLSGEKSFEFRVNDRGFQKGDIVSYQVVNEVKDERGRDKMEYIDHPINDVCFEITYVLAGWHISGDYVIFSQRKIEEQPDAIYPWERHDEN